MPGPSNHLLLLHKINSIIDDIAIAQHYIDAARRLPLAGNHYQLMLDRKQTELDEKKDVVAAMLVEIPMSN